MKKSTSIFSLAGALLLCGSLSAEVPATINYRGWLDGYPPDQVTETLIFRLYNSPVSSSPLNEMTLAVDIYDGNFSVLLDFAPSDFLEPARYIGVFKADGTTELTNPRPQVVTVPYAYQAGNLYSTTDGKVGLGTNTPQEALDVVGRIRTSQGISFNGAVQSTAAFGDGHSLDAADGLPADAVFVNNAGNVGLGLTNPSERLHVMGKVRATSGVLYPDGNTQTVAFDGHSLDASDGNPADAVRVDSVGDLIASGGGTFADFVSADGLTISRGDAPPQDVLIVDRNTYGGTIANFQNPMSGWLQIGLRVATYQSGSRPLTVGYHYLTGSPGFQSLAYRENFYVEYNGNAWLRGTLTEGSDARFKANVEPLSGCLGKVLNLQGVTYNWRPDEPGNERKDTQIGFIGQEVHEVIPELAPVNEEGHYGVIYNRLVPVLVEAVKEQQSIIDSQNSKIDSLENELETVKMQMSHLQSLIEERN